MQSSIREWREVTSDSGWTYMDSLGKTWSRIDSWWVSEGVEAKRVRGIEPAALEALGRYPWPGNVRELEQAVRSIHRFGHRDKLIVKTDNGPALLSLRQEVDNPVGAKLPATDLQARPIPKKQEGMIGDTAGSRRSAGLAACTRPGPGAGS